MSSVTPPPPPAPPSLAAATANTTAVVVGAQQALQNVQAGLSLQATITALTAANQLQVQTALGTLTLQTSLMQSPAFAPALTKGAVLTLVLSNLSPQPTVQITTINGKALPGAPANWAATAPTASTPLSSGDTVSVTLLRPAPAAAQVTPGGQVTPTGATPTGQPSQATPGATPGTTQSPAGQGAPSTTATQSATPSGQAAPQPASQAASQAASQVASQTTASRASSTTTPTATTSTTASGTATNTPTLPSGTRFTATVQRVETANAAVSTPAAQSGRGLAMGQVVSGTVSGRTTGGQPIVQTPNATFALNAPGASLADGAKVTLRLNSAPLPPSSFSDAAARLGTDGMHDRLSGQIHAKSWSGLDDALKALAGADPARLAQVAQHALPQAGPKLTNQMLFFLSALKGGDIKGLFGETASRLIDKERPGLIQRLGGEFQAMSRLADEPQSGDWRLALIPMWNGEKVEQIRYFWRGNGGGEDGESEEETRFVLDLELSNLGHLQVDGLVKAKRKHLDLILRTDQPLSPEMRTDIATIFETARETLGLGGQVAFQAAPGNFVSIPTALPDTAAPTLTSGLMA